jgi:hypothetical protein
MCFLLEEGRFHDDLKDKPAIWSIAQNKKKQKNQQNIYPQLIHMTLTGH